MALQDPGKPLAQFERGGGRPGPDRAGDVGGAVQVLGAAIDQVDLVGAERAVGFRGDPIVDDRTVIAGARNGREALAAEALDRLAQGQEFRGGGDLRELAGAALLGQDVQEAADRDGIALVGVARALAFHRILAGLRQQAGIGGIGHMRAGRAQGLGEPDRRSRAVQAHSFVGQAGQGRGESFPARDRHAVAEPGAGRLRQLGGVHEKLHARVLGVQQGEAEREWRERDIGATDVEQPGDRGGVRENGRILFGGAQQGGNVLALFDGGAAGIVQAMRHGRGQRGGRAIRPDGVDRVLGQRHHIETGGGVAGKRLLADQHRVVGDDGIDRGVRGQPSRRRLFQQMAAFPQGGVSLLFQLQHVAPVGEHRRTVGQHHRQAGAAGEAG